MSGILTPRGVELSVIIDEERGEKGGETAQSNSSVASPMRKSIEQHSRLKHDLIHSQALMLVIEFQADGKFEYKDMRRVDIYEETKKLVVNSKHQSSLVVPRDLRLLDPSFDVARSKAAMLVRNNAIIVSIKPMFVCVMHHKCYVLVPEGADSILAAVLSRLGNPENIDMETPFEFRALESVFISLSNDLATELKEVSAQATAAFKAVETDFEGRKLEDMKIAKDNIRRLIALISDSKNALVEVLENDEDLARMYLSDWVKDNDIYDHKKHPNWKRHHVEAELLLEAYLLEFDSILETTMLLNEEMQSVEALIDMQLAAGRNRLLVVDTIISVAIVCVTFSTFVTGIFGMNLNSYVQEADYWFYCVIGAITVIPTMVFTIIMCYLKSAGVFGGLAYIGTATH